MKYALIVLLDPMTPDANYVAYDQDNTKEDAYDNEDEEIFAGVTADGVVVYRYLEKDIELDSEEDTLAAFDFYIPETHPLYNVVMLSLYKNRVGHELDRAVIVHLMNMLQNI